MSKEVRSRDYLEYKIIKRSHIESIDNFKKIPDSIFFTMTEVIEKYKIPEVVFFRIMERESKFQFIDNKEGSSAKGYMQVVKSTFDQHYKKLNLLGGHNKENNIKVAASLLSTIHEFWKTQFPKDNRKSWEYSICEYGCGRLPMITNNGFIIPSESRPGIDYVMSYY
jgi:hypothetical protein